MLLGSLTGLVRPDDVTVGASPTCVFANLVDIAWPAWLIAAFGERAADNPEKYRRDHHKTEPKLPTSAVITWNVIAAHVFLSADSVNDRRPAARVSASSFISCRVIPR